MSPLHEQEMKPITDLQREIIVESFKAVRSEISDRIRLRDQTLAAYLAGVVGIVGFALSRQTEQAIDPLDLLLFTPALSFAAAKIIADNHRMVSALALYQALELCRFPGLSELPLWERSDALLRPDVQRMAGPNHNGVRKRVWRLDWIGRSVVSDDVAVTDTIAVAGPAAAALTLYWLAPHVVQTQTTFPKAVLFWLAVALLLWSVRILWQSGRQRDQRRRGLRKQIDAGG